MVRRDSLLRAAACPRFAPLIDTHLATRGNAQLAVDYHPLTRFDAFLDHHQVALTLPQCHWPLLSGRILFDHVNKRSLRRHLGRRCRHQNGATNSVKYEPDIDEAPGPETIVAIGNRRAEIYGPGGVLHGVVEKSKLTGDG